MTAQDCNHDLEFILRFFKRGTLYTKEKKYFDVTDEQLMMTDKHWPSMEDWLAGILVHFDVRKSV